MKSPLAGGGLQSLHDTIDFLAQLQDADEDRVWGRIVEKLAVALDAEAATYFVFLPKQRQLVVRHCLGMAASQLSGVPIEIGVGVCGWVARHREPVIVEDVRTDARFLSKVDEITGFTTRSILALPILDRMELAGVIELLNRRDRGFAPEDLRLAVSITALASMALRAARMETTVQKVTSYHASVLENLGGGFIAADGNGRVIMCNPAARKILGISPEMPLQIPLAQALSHIPEFAEILMRTLTTRHAIKRQDLRWTHNGQEKLLGYSTLLIRDPEGNISGAGITFQDITNV